MVGFADPGEINVSTKRSVVCAASFMLGAVVVATPVRSVLGQQPRPFVCGMAAGIGDLGQLGTVIPASAINPRLAEAIHLDCDELRNLLVVRTQVLILEERAAPNAFAAPRPGDDGFVYLGHKLIRTEFAARRGYAIPSILGHEYCHVEQARRVVSLQGKHRELHSDFFGGWFMAHRQQFVPGNQFEGWFSLMAKGDYAFGNPQHHGTPQERGAAFAAGYNSYAGNRNPQVAFNQGVDYVVRFVR
jgi:hypothetical protein